MDRRVSRFEGSRVMFAAAAAAILVALALAIARAIRGRPSSIEYLRAIRSALSQ